MVWLLIPCYTFAQTEIRDKVQYIVFESKFPGNDKTTYDVDEIDFGKEQPEAVFTLAGPIPLRYKMRLVNDTLAQLYRFNNGWQHGEDMQYVSSFFERFENDNLLHTNFEISDFDKDGDEDLICWVFDTMNGNGWSHIYLNDQETLKLVKLKNIEDEGYWVLPRYDASTGNIICSEFGSELAPSYIAKYQLNGLEALPINKNCRWHNEDNDEYYTFKGSNGEWVLTSNSSNIDLRSEKSPRYCLKQNNESEVLLLKYNDADSIPVFQEKFAYKGWLNQFTSHLPDEPGYNITDFNEDGYNDLVIEQHSGESSEIATIIFLQDVKAKKLVKLYNSIENSDIWYNPIYNIERRIISCEKKQDGKLSARSIYKLEGTRAILLPNTEY